jgi:hypothetical protein
LHANWGLCSGTCWRAEPHGHHHLGLAPASLALTFLFRPSPVFPRPRPPPLLCHSSPPSFRLDPPGLGPHVRRAAPPAVGVERPAQPIDQNYWDVSLHFPHISRRNGPRVDRAFFALYASLYRVSHHRSRPGGYKTGKKKARPPDMQRGMLVGSAGEPSSPPLTSLASAACIASAQ